MKTLTKQTALVTYETGTGAPEQDAWFDEFSTGIQGEWVKIAANNFFLIGNEQYIDLNGLNIDDKTVFFDAITVQSPLPPIIEKKSPVSPAIPAGASIIIHDIITSVPLALDDNTPAQLGYGIGYMQSQYDFEHVIYYRSQTWATDVDYAGNICNLTHQSQSGSGMPTASDRLYCYRFVQWSPQVQNAKVTIMPSRFVLGVQASKENDLTYIYRLKRSYELQQRFDRD